MTPDQEQQQARMNAFKSIQQGRTPIQAANATNTPAGPGASTPAATGSTPQIQQLLAQAQGAAGGSQPQAQAGSPQPPMPQQPQMPAGASPQAGMPQAPQAGAPNQQAAPIVTNTQNPDAFGRFPQGQESNMRNQSVQFRGSNSDAPLSDQQIQQQQVQSQASLQAIQQLLQQAKPQGQPQ